MKVTEHITDDASASELIRALTTAIFHEVFDNLPRQLEIILLRRLTNRKIDKIS